MTAEQAQPAHEDELETRIRRAVLARVDKRISDLEADNDRLWICLKSVDAVVNRLDVAIGRHLGGYHNETGGA
jgi:hypothetical protein